MPVNRGFSHKDFFVDEDRYARLSKERRERNYGIADLHVHSDAGDGMASIESILDSVQYWTSLNAIAITDHDMIDGALEARNLAIRKGYDFEVIVGCEVTSLQGHVLALFVEKPLRSLQSLEKTIEEIHEQDGLCIIPHPMNWLTRSVGRKSIERVLSQGLTVDGVETMNASLMGKLGRAQIRQLNEETYNLAETGGSDAHFLPDLGSGHTVFQGKTEADVRKSVLSRSTQGQLGQPLAFGKVTVDQLLAQQVKSLIVLPARHARRAVRTLLKEA